MTTYIKKDFMSGPLLHPTKIFVDAPNLIYYADVRVITRLIAIMYHDDQYRRMFESLFVLLRTYPSESLQTITQMKRSWNILYDIVEWKVVREIDTEKTPFQYLDDLYNTLLFDINDVPAEFIPTTIGSALKVIVNHRYLEKMYIYLPTTNIANTFEELAGFFQVNTGDKLELISGGSIGAAILSLMDGVDEYFLSNVDDIKHIAAIDTIKTKRIYLPAFAHNFEKDTYGRSEEDGVEKVEGPTYHRPMNMDVNLIGIPY